jgi:hypothetical protein
LTVASIFEFKASNQKKINHKPSKFQWKNQRRLGKFFFKKKPHLRGHSYSDDTLAIFAEI